LFDEIEKAHPEVWNSLLQILDDGRLTDGQGRTVDFRNTVLIMTSNLGTEFVRRGGTLGFLRKNGTDEERQEHDKIDKALKETFRPEFLNRIDEIIMFSSLNIDDMRKIVQLQMHEVSERLNENGLKVELTEKAVDWLAREGFDTDFGARPLRRALQKYVESPLSIRLLSGEFSNGDSILVDVDDEDKITFTRAGGASPHKKETRPSKTQVTIEGKAAES
jgi:ATP-dependent Clp protease ATP-binding subunit ClpC